ncbi:MAG: MBL fold metallo-hydrolase [Lysobacterales bacterium CG02_land_8_20_14_3_00_62_12]|nr:MAG: MBL fold metallo-hydrolase [Xanthomonadales bacterium CG02_land_8_20_14_3_00_62_12]
MKLQYFGAAGEVTGSCHWLHAADKNILLDCGMIQGGREEHERNAAAFPFAVEEIDAVVLSHAHIDHCGRLPLLHKRGYRGPIYTHHATAALAKIMLEDSARLAAQDVEYQNRRRARRGLPAFDVLYDQADVQGVLTQLRGLDYGKWQSILPAVEVRLADAGHILGAAIVEVQAVESGQQRKLVFSGDLGPKGAPILCDPTSIEAADLVMMESTYGDRLHRNRSDTLAELGEIFQQVRGSGGNVLIPAFAVGRTQEILYWFAQRFDEWGLADFRIVLDSPMATKVTAVYGQHQELFDIEARRVWKSGHDPFRLPNLRFVESIEESQALNRISKGLIIIAGSGMCNGGRIKHHLKHHLWRNDAHVIFPGYQAQGTLGRLLVDGAETVRIYGEEIKVNAHRHTIGGLSAHADQAGLADWYGQFKRRPRVVLVHGEDTARAGLAQVLRDRFAAEVTLAEVGGSATIE